MLLVVFTVPEGRVKAETDDTLSEIEETSVVNSGPVIDSQPAGITRQHRWFIVFKCSYFDGNQIR